METGEEETSKTGKTEVNEIGKSGGETDKDEDTKSTKKEGEEEEKPEEDRVKDCFPEFMNRWCAKKCPCASCKSPEDSALMKKWHSVRNVVCIIVEHRFFEWFILVIIFASSITLVSADGTDNFVKFTDNFVKFILTTLSSSQVYYLSEDIFN